MKIIMYHYVRDIAKSKFKKLKALDIKKFEQQVKKIKKKYNAISPAEVKYIIKNNLRFSNKDYWLTFDDGYIDHYKYVIPILDKYNIKGSFFPTVSVFKKNNLMDVNKLQLILAEISDHKFILKKIENYYNLFVKNKNSIKFSYYLKKKIISKNRFDDLNTIKIKHLLQTELSPEIRSRIINILLKKYLKIPIRNIYKNFYMNLNQLSEIKENGHEIGLHGFNHLRLGKLTKKKQSKDILNSIKFWKSKKMINNDFSFCYPFGDYNKDTLEILSKNGCLIGLTTTPKKVNLRNYRRLELPRYDTNDFFRIN